MTHEEALKAYLCSLLELEAINKRMEMSLLLSESTGIKRGRSEETNEAKSSTKK